MWYSCALYAQSFGGVDCDADHCLAVAKVRERLAVSKQATHRFHMQKFTLKKLNEVKGKDQYRVEISTKFAALKNLHDNVNIVT
jgi:hypothetical protein